MTVAELIVQLEGFDQNLHVFAGDGSEYANEILASTGLSVMKTNLGQVLIIGNGDGPLATVL